MHMVPCQETGALQSKHLIDAIGVLSAVFYAVCVLLLLPSRPVGPTCVLCDPFLTPARAQPRDMTLCVGDGYIIEGVNRALRIYNATSGAPLTATLSLNQFLSFPPVITRSEDDGMLT